MTIRVAWFSLTVSFLSVFAYAATAYIMGSMTVEQNWHLTYRWIMWMSILSIPFVAVVLYEFFSRLPNPIEFGFGLIGAGIILGFGLATGVLLKTAIPMLVEWRTLDAVAIAFCASLLWLGGVLHLLVFIPHRSRGPLSTGSFFITLLAFVLLIKAGMTMQ